LVLAAAFPSFARQQLKEAVATASRVATTVIAVSAAVQLGSTTDSVSYDCADSKSFSGTPVLNDPQLVHAAQNKPLTVSV